MIINVTTGIHHKCLRSGLCNVTKYTNEISKTPSWPREVFDCVRILSAPSAFSGRLPDRLQPRPPSPRPGASRDGSRLRRAYAVRSSPTPRIACPVVQAARQPMQRTPMTAAQAPRAMHTLRMVTTRSSIARRIGSKGKEPLRSDAYHSIDNFTQECRRSPHHMSPTVYVECSSDCGSPPCAGCFHIVPDKARSGRRFLNKFSANTAKLRAELTHSEYRRFDQVRVISETSAPGKNRPIYGHGTIVLLTGHILIGLRRLQEIQYYASN